MRIRKGIYSGVKSQIHIQFSRTGDPDYKLNHPIRIVIYSNPGMEC